MTDNNLHGKEAREDELDEVDDVPVRMEVELDWEALALAFENQLPDSFSFLHLTDGKVITLLSDTHAPPEPPQPHDEYLFMPPRPPQEGYKTMQKFIEVMEEPDVKEKLAMTLVGKGAFRRFKDQLLAYPEVRQKWFAFKDSEVYAYIRNWLRTQGIKSKNEPPLVVSKERVVAGGKAFGEDRRREQLKRVMKAPPNESWRAAIAPYDRPRLMFRPAKTALLLIDLQKVFVDPRGDNFLPMSVRAVEMLRELVDVCRKNGLAVIFTRHVHNNPLEDGGAMAGWWRSLILEGTLGSELIDTIRPIPGERVITKCRYSAFMGTPLEMVLRALKVEDLLIGGVMTNLCCETTARDAFIRDFNIFFLGDGTATVDDDLQVGSLRNIAFGFGRVLGVADAMRILLAGTDA